VDALLRCAVAFARHHPAETASRLEGLSAAETVGFLDHLDPPQAAQVLDRMAPGRSAACIELMDDSRASELLVGLEDRQRIRVLRQIESSRRDRVLAALPENTRRSARRALAMPEDSAGAIADPSVTAISTDMTAGTARQATHDPRVPYLYVVDRDHRLVGVVHKRDVQSGPDDARLDQMLEGDVTRVPAHATVAQLHRHRAWRDLDALPVVDGKGTYVGAIRHKDLRRIAPRPPGPVATSSPFSIVLDLAELFWLGLSDVLRGLSATTPAEGDPT
jgi:magnesium transporter